MDTELPDILLDLQKLAERLVELTGGKTNE